MKIFKLTLLLTLCLSIAFVSSCKKDDNEDCTEQTWFEDLDGDGLGDPNISQVHCEQPTGYVNNQNDLNDKNNFTYNSTNFEINNAYLEDYGNYGTQGTNFDLFLFTDGVTYDGNNNQFTGNGNGLYFEMFSSSSTGLATGTYTFDVDESGDPNTFDLGYIFIDYDFDGLVGTLVSITAGTVTVTRNEASYDFTFTLTTTAGNQISGNYSGTAPII